MKCFKHQGLMKYALYLPFFVMSIICAAPSSTLTNSIFVTQQNTTINILRGSNFYEALSVNFIDSGNLCTTTCQASLPISLFDQHALLAVSNNGIFVTASYLNTSSRVTSVIKFAYFFPIVALNLLMADLRVPMLRI